MGLLGMFKLEKLTIEAYDDPARGIADLQETFEAMYNPTSIKQSYAIKWNKTMGKGKSSPKPRYEYTKPSALDLDLIFDGTGVEQMGVISLFNTKSVNDRIKEFMTAAYTYAGDIHEPYYLTVKWGLPEPFKCRLSSFDINYTSFDRDGTPLRAELKVSLVADEDPVRGEKKANPLSADLTHSRMFCAGDTLPLLARQIYGSSVYYLDLARFNTLNDFRNILPGVQILFPPLEQLIDGR